MKKPKNKKPWLMIIKKTVPDAVKQFVKYYWEKIRPPQIVLTAFEKKGCRFEITTRMEKVRVLSLGEEEEFVRRLLAEIRPGDVYFDIGSCVGLHALHAALYGAQVVAFEPDPGYRRRLKRNIKINGLKKSVRVIEWAVSDRRGRAKLYTDGVNGNSPSLYLVGDRGAVVVKTDTIDNAILEGRIPKPDLVKLDIEGAEILALRGMKRLLVSNSAPRCLFVEFHPEFLHGFNSSVDECMELIESFGYVQEHCESRSNQLHCIYSKAR